MYLKEIKTRREDYWNKICLYNLKMHQLELQEAIKKKNRDQADTRRELGAQVQGKQDDRAGERDSDFQYMKRNSEHQAKLQAEHIRKMDEKKKHLQQINKERF